MTKTRIAGLMGVLLSILLVAQVLTTAGVWGQSPLNPREQLTAVLTGLTQEGVINADQARIILERSAPIFNAPADAAPQPAHKPQGIDRKALLLNISQLLGLEPQEVIAQLRQGKTVAELAAAQGMTLEELVVLLTADAEAKLMAAVDEGKLTLREAEHQLKQLRRKLFRVLNDIRLNTHRLSLEMHWGFIDRLGGATNDPSLLMPMSGSISISDGDEATEEGLHLISALLFESGGAWEAGLDDDIVLPPYWTPSVEWRSATTDDWDGMAVNFRWEKGTDPVITIETDQWSGRFPALELREMLREPQVMDIGGQGQKLEIGQFFTLSYRVYDMRLEWGYDPAQDSDPTHQPRLTVWDGSLSLSQGGIRLLSTLRFEQDGDYSQGRDDQVLAYADLGSQLSWRSSTLDPLRRRKELDGLALNYVVPRGVEATVTLDFAEHGRETIALPHRFQDMHWEKAVDDYGHYIHAHLHWCWFKASPGPGDTALGH
ncbi:MAG: hypothetical protein ACE5IA_07300 [Dehalococcoidia bacterium]